MLGVFFFIRRSHASVFNLSPIIRTTAPLRDLFTDAFFRQCSPARSTDSYNTRRTSCPSVVPSGSRKTRLVWAAGIHEDCTTKRHQGEARVRVRARKRQLDELGERVVRARICEFAAPTPASLVAFGQDSQLCETWVSKREVSWPAEWDEQQRGRMGRGGERQRQRWKERPRWGS
jgi:hypothetical protein